MSDPKSVRAYGLASKTRVAAYLHHFASHDRRVTGLKLSLDVPRAGKAVWYSPEDGKVLGHADVQAGRQTLEVPAFQVDIALLIGPVG